MQRKSSETQNTLIIKQLLSATKFLATEKIGAIIAIERLSSLSEYAEAGVAVNTEINSELLSSLFWPGTPTHDGAIIIRNGKIDAAGCFLPLTNSKLTDRRLGTRHRVALGYLKLAMRLLLLSQKKKVLFRLLRWCLTRFLTIRHRNTFIYCFF